MAAHARLHRGQNTLTVCWRCDVMQVLGVRGRACGAEACFQCSDIFTCTTTTAFTSRPGLAGSTACATNWEGRGV